jgi:hypothetical protein
MTLLGYVKALERLDSRPRGDRVLTELARLGLSPVIEGCRWPRVRNLVVDFSADARANRLVFSAHHDVVAGSLGANDDASGVAVLLRLCEELKGTGAPVRVVFFDREEAWFRTPVLRLGLLGSLYHVWCRPQPRMEAVYNLEFVGLGDRVAVWPVKDERQAPVALGLLGKAAATLGVSVERASFPWVLLSGDHLLFRLRGIREALSLSLVPGAAVQQISAFLTGLSVPGVLAGRRPRLPEPLSCLHTPRDTSERPSEQSLSLMLSLVLEIVREFRGSSC